MSRRAISLAGTVLVAVLAAGGWWVQQDQGGEPAPSEQVTSPTAVTSSDDASGLPYVDLADLPPEAADVVALIDEGGPFRYDKDGSTFGNYEGLLPDRPGGYYREYTVETPGSDDRGARRIIGGAEGELYWTEDHYESFEVIRR